MDIFHCLQQTPNQDQSFFSPLIFATSTSPSYHILQSMIGTDTMSLQFIHILVFVCVFSWSDIGPQKHPAKRKLKHRNLGKFRFYSLTKILYMFSLQHMLSRDPTSLFHFKQKDRRRHPKANLEIVCLGLSKLKEKGSSILVSTVDSICCSTDP